MRRKESREKERTKKEEEKDPRDTPKF